MAKKKNGVSQSEEIRRILRANPKMQAKEVVSTLASQGVHVKPPLVYFVKGRLKGQRGRRKKAQEMVASVVATGNTDPVATILKVKRWASEVGGMKKLKALVDALME